MCTIPGIRDTNVEHCLDLIIMEDSKERIKGTSYLSTYRSIPPYPLPKQLATATNHKQPQTKRPPLLHPKRPLNLNVPSNFSLILIHSPKHPPLAINRIHARWQGGYLGEDSRQKYYLRHFSSTGRSTRPILAPITRPPSTFNLVSHRATARDRQP